ncbi:MAG: thiamine phosphate synthase [Bacteroidales bacterium]
MLQFITHAKSKQEIVEQVKTLLSGGCKWVQLRMKNASKEEITETAKELKELCAEWEAIFIVDDWVDVAKELELDGVHLGKNDMPVAEARMELGDGAIIGATANCYEDIEALRGVDVDYIGLGPLRFTSTKEKLSPILGLDGYRAITEKMADNGITIPTVAIGGITFDDIQTVMDCGVNGVAVSGGIINSDNPIETTEKMITLLNKIVDKRNNK